MVVPWVGFPLHKLLAMVEPTSNAKYVAFQTRYAPDEMPGRKIGLSAAGLIIRMWKGYVSTKLCTPSPC